MWAGQQGKGKRAREVKSVSRWRRCAAALPELHGRAGAGCGLARRAVAWEGSRPVVGSDWIGSIYCAHTAVDL